jgi:DNA-binding response OmpR family regulator
MESETSEVLVIERYPECSDLLNFIIKNRNLSYKVRTFTDGQPALDFLASITHVPCIIFLDTSLQETDGFRVLQEIKENSFLRETPVLMLASALKESDIKRSYEFGAADYVAKGGSHREFSQTIIRLFNYWVLEKETANSQ